MSVLIFILSLVLSSTLIGQPLPTNTSSMFSASGTCQNCHTGSGSILTENGVDISPITDWRSTMMANAAKDPLWRAKVSAEVAENPALQTVIESKCTKCHSPMGYTQAIHNGQSGYSIQEMENSTLALDGVSCTACHQIKNTNFGQNSSFTGGYDIDTTKTIYGPYQNPFAMPMINMTGFTPVFTNHLNESELCATCHTLFTPYVDNNGQVAGEFPEQVPYFEWKNSIYPTQNKNCQTCHMPQTQTPIDIATNPPWETTLRTPYWKHHFVGGNTFMLNLLKNNMATLGIPSSASHFDSTIAKTRAQLENNTINLSESHSIVNDSLNLVVAIENLTGHKLPSAVPIRRVWLHVKVSDSQNQIVFESGKWDSTGEIVSLDLAYEPHYNEITDETQVQVYEGIMKDVDNNQTFTFLRAAEFLKDNRIPPKGFTTNYAFYDTVKIVGNAENDANFNIENGNEGSGKDLVTYKIPVLQNEVYSVEIEACYQSVMPRFVNHLFTLSTNEIATFQGMYNNEINEPEIMSSVNFNVGTATDLIENENSILEQFALSQNFPNPFNPTTKINYQIPNGLQGKIQIFNILGEKIRNFELADSNGEINWNGLDNYGKSVSSGIYFYEIQAGNFSDMKKMVLLK
ncbi:MAG: T9SS C-terminal target domain-containing protein [Calditrichaeota bacterium]|nr:MAG: T9SS C-terminal target domain-containing protein [Calditrichota bacterium]